MYVIAAKGKWRAAPLRGRGDFAPAFAEPQFYLSLRVSTPALENNLVAVLEELQFLSTVECHRFRPSFCRLEQATELELVALFVNALWGTLFSHSPRETVRGRGKGGRTSPDTVPVPIRSPVCIPHPAEAW